MSVRATKVSSRKEVDKEPNIHSIQVLSSGTAAMHREHRYGTWKPQLWWVLTSQSWVEAPINYFLIKHRSGPVLFDTGLDPRFVSDPRYIESPIGRFLAKRIFKFDITDDDRLDKVLEREGVQAADIQTAVFSHLHFDHVGGVAEIPQADLIVSAKEWSQLSKPHPERDWIFREYLNPDGARWQQEDFKRSEDPLFADFEGVYDVAGDGSMILLPTPGHTPGSLSMLVQQEGWAPILLVGDLMYDGSFLDNDITPGTGDTSELKKSFAKVRGLKDKLPDLVIVPSHDAAATENICLATKSMTSSEVGAA